MKTIIVHASKALLASPNRGLLSRSISASLLLSHSVRSDVKLEVFIDDVRISFVSQKMRNIRPDEQSLLGVINKAVRIAGSKPRKVFEGVYVRHEDIASFAASIKHGDKLFYDDLEGSLLNIHEVRTPFSIVFTLSEPIKLRDLLSKQGFKRVKLGSSKLHVDQVIAVLNILLDRGEQLWRYWKKL
ncbi:MAG: hypothetical protein DRJ33_05715 [Candidatus Methanomethylicota archaeon]|uniref:tRNA (pseudouridine(54)-N(1))-methyltransferase n=1 Tax=Thermoproteota archaeon TaxID=2056631 RepID=A0A497EVZ1_9CREN|nr:MAG: hypothetical protein DRJ33_05715 [Candidatus Verstraetearchaeota archaeon]